MWRSCGSCGRRRSTTWPIALTTSFAAPGEHGSASHAAYAERTAAPCVGSDSTGMTAPLTPGAVASVASLPASVAPDPGEGAVVRGRF
jgi:hypothetical protein